VDGRGDQPQLRPANTDEEDTIRDASFYVDSDTVPILYFYRFPIVTTYLQDRKYHDHIVDFVTVFQSPMEKSHHDYRKFQPHSVPSVHTTPL
jgi:hypothetical protein